MRSSRFVLGVFPLIWALQALGQETATLAPLPEGDSGLAAKYPGDAGIEKDPAVLVYDGFEECAQVADVHKKWNFVLHDENMRIAEEPANVNHGKRAVEFVLPQQQEASSAALYKVIKEERDVVFLRFYSKFEKDYDHPRGSSHNGGVIAAHYFPGRRATPGQRADGRNKFLANFETMRGALPSPGALNVYCYHPEQRGAYGDNLYPSGKIGRSSEPHPYGLQFLARPEVIPELGRWYCYEFMLKANTPGQRDGRIACWLDGKLIADFPNLRLRDVEDLKIDLFGIALYLNPNTARANKKWFDDVVAATSYIGPIAGEKKPPAKP
jgi:hypothetical protein